MPVAILTPMAMRPQPDTVGAAHQRTGAGFLNMANRNKPIVEITLDDEQQGCFVPSYTTLEKIQGVASITTPVDTPFDELHITFQGSTRAYVEKIASAALGPTSSRLQATHNFLRLSQPINQADIPDDHILRPGQTYSFPFMFVVPEQLLPQSCSHSKDNPALDAAHLALPPSLGDPMMAGDGKSLLNDLAPDMTVISYTLRVLILRRGRDADAKPEVVVDSVKKLRIIPKVDESPPLRTTGDKDDEYTMKKERMLKKGIFKGKLGLLTVEAAQPRSIHLPSIRSKNARPVTTMAVFNLRFDPADDSTKPPRLGQLWTRLKIATFFSSVPMRDFPTKSNAYIYDTQRGIYVETVPLSSRSVQSAQWTPHAATSCLTPPPELESPLRRDSGISILRRDSFLREAFMRRDSAPALTECPAPASQYYTCQILVPIDLPTGSKTFVPTFHSCLVSRVYSLDLTLSVNSPNSTVSSPHIHLKIPLQISSEGNADARPTISDEEAAAIAAREADSDLLPRTLAPPSPEYTENARLMPPERRWSSMLTMEGGRGLVGRTTPDSGSSGDEGAPPEYSAFGRRAHDAGMGLGMARPVWDPETRQLR